MKNKMKIYLSSLFMFFLIQAFPAAGQYYYRDFISRTQAETEMKNYKEAKVKNIDVNSYEGDGNPSRGFICYKKIDRNYTGSEMFTRTNITGPSQFNSYFDKEGKLSSTYDSSLISVTNTQYFYDATGKLLKTRSRLTSRDDDFHNEIIQEHIYVYAGNNLPQKLHLVKNGRDTTTILFASDEAGNMAIEKNTKTGAKYFYIYNAKNQLTQIAQETALRRDPYPNYIFTYNNAGNISQMITTEEGGRNIDYTIWRYSYEDGLKTGERLMTRERKLLGSIEYIYKKGK